MPTVESHGATLYYEVHGDGPALVFAHGAGGNTLSWFQQVPHFARGHRVVTFDHRGFGRSSCPIDAIRPRYFAQDLRAILDATGIERAALICQSMGGWGGLRFALTWPERASCLALCDTPGGVLTEKILAGMASSPGMVMEHGLAAVSLAPDYPKRNPPMAQLYAEISGLNPPLETLPLAGALVQERVDVDELRTYAVPTLVIVGERDALFSSDSLQEVAALIPGAEACVIPGVGHSSYFEDPETFNRIVGGFISQHH
jgi:pimeloyl-ACP methyl ester carboxylesterase